MTPSSTTSAQLAPCLNEKGALHLVADNLKQASEYFQSALDAIESRYKGSRPTSEQGDCMPMVGGQVVQRQASQDSFGNFIYSTPFVISTKGTHQIPSKHDLKAYTAVILFNLGVTYQLMYEKTIDGDSSVLEMAMRSYNRCLRLLKEEHMVYECPDLMVAALNNKAAMCYQSTDFDSSSKLFKILCTILKCKDMRENISIPNDVLQSVILNISFSKAPTAAGSA